MKIPNSLLGSFTALLLTSIALPAQELIYQEGFNTDGDGTRYTTQGRGVVPDSGAGGAAYWAHNFDVTAIGKVVGVVQLAPARRAAITWHHTITPDIVTSNALQLFDATITWLLNGKANARIMFSPAASGDWDTFLQQRLMDKGHTVTDDDASTAPPAPANLDLVIQSSSGVVSPTRFTSYAVPLLSYNAGNHDDELTSSIGTTVQNFDPGELTLADPSHPIAAGQPNKFRVVTTPASFDTIGVNIPEKAKVIATYGITTTRTVASLGEVDQMIDGSFPSTKSSGTIAVADLAMPAPGDWPDDLAVPGNPTGAFGTLGTGKITVTAPGTYTFALGIDDGARLRIDRDRNGFSAADNIVVQDGTGSFRGAFGDATFSAPGEYDFQWITFNAGGDYGAEVSVATAAGAGTPGPVNAGGFEVLGTSSPTSPVRLAGNIAITTYVPNAPPVTDNRPFLIVIERGDALLGGLINGQEGTGFFAGADMNDPGIADCCNSVADPRVLTLRAVNVAGKQNVKLTVALAATDVDFEPEDFLRISADIDGAGPADFVTIADFRPPTSSDKFFSDGKTKLNIRFQDVTFDIPSGATDLVIKFESMSTFFNEIVAFDNVRITAGAAAAPTISIRRTGADNSVIEVQFTGTIERATSVTGPWTAVPGNPSSPLVIPAASQLTAQFFRVR